MRDRTFGSRDTASIITFLRDFKATYSTCNVHEAPALFVFKQFLTGPVEEVIKALIAIPAKTARDEKRCLTSYSAIVDFLFERYATDDKIALVEGNMRQL